MDLLSALAQTLAWLQHLTLVKAPPDVKVVVAFSGPYFRVQQGVRWSAWMGFN